jgi:dimethylargininase
MLDTPTRAVVRRFPDTYITSYRRKGVDINPALALEQHRAYTQCLERSGVQVDHVPADDAFYDCVFVEDTAIVWRSDVLMTRMANADRQGEQAAVREHFARTHEIVELPAGATLDGGDVMHLDQVTYVGLSSRTNAGGAEALSKFMDRAGRPVVTVKLSNALHLKTAATYLGNGTIIAAPGCIDLDQFTDVRVIQTPRDEAGAANCVRIGDSLLVPSGYPASERLLSEFASTHSLRTEILDITQFEKGGGSLTCLSLLWRQG